MSDDKFFERLRSDARQLRYEPDEVAIARLTSRIRARIAEQPTTEQFLARWFRPLTASLAAVALGAVLSIAWVEMQNGEASADLIAASSEVELSVAGDLYSVGE